MGSGAFELPLLAKKLATAKENRYDAVNLPGYRDRGATPHFRFCSFGSFQGIANVGLETGKPVIYAFLRRQYRTGDRTSRYEKREQGI